MPYLELVTGGPERQAEKVECRAPVVPRTWCDTLDCSAAGNALLHVDFTHHAVLGVLEDVAVVHPHAGLVELCHQL